MGLIPLHDYQQVTKDFILKNPYCGVFLKMGLGKTASVLDSLYDLNPAGHVLIIAPKTVARSTWSGEIEKWNMPFRTKSLIVNEKGKDLSKAKREKIFDEIPSMPPTMFFINREMVVKLVNYYDERNVPWLFPTVIIDESQSFKSYKASRFKALKQVRPQISRLIELSGTPSPQGPMDLWAQMYLLDMGRRLGKTITKYRETYFLPGIIVNNYPATWHPRYGAEELIYDKISDICISMENVKLMLPEVTFTDIYAHMYDDEMKLYKTMAKEYVLDITEDHTVEAANAAVLCAKLSQMASGALYLETGSHEFKVIHEHKLELCDYLIEDAGSPVMIAYNFHSDKEMLLEHFKKTGTDARVFDGTPEMVKAWNNDEIPVMLLQPASGGFGLNLQEGSGHTLIWYTIPWSLEQYEQTNSRIHRQGQKNNVMIYRLVTKGTIDQQILRSIENKSMTQKDMLNAIDISLAMMNS